MHRWKNQPYPVDGFEAPRLRLGFYIASAFSQLINARAWVNVHVNPSPSRLSAGKCLCIKPSPAARVLYSLSFFSADKRWGSGIYYIHICIFRYSTLYSVLCTEEITLLQNLLCLFKGFVQPHGGHVLWAAQPTWPDEDVLKLHNGKVVRRQGRDQVRPVVKVERACPLMFNTVAGKNTLPELKMVKCFVKIWIWVKQSQKEKKEYGRISLVWC